MVFKAKKYLYITLCVVLGLLLSFLIHGLLEIWILSTITSNLGRYGDSFLFQNWELVHSVGGLTLTVTGLTGGLVCGFRFWQILYVEKRYGEPWL